MKLETKLISSLGRIFPDEIKGDTLKRASMLKNEAFSFQVAFKNENSAKDVVRLYVRIDTDLDISLVSEYLQGFVPVTRADVPGSDGYFERKGPGLFPDVLLERKTNAHLSDCGLPWLPIVTEQDQKYLLESSADSYKGLWFTVNEDGEDIKAGKYYIRVLFYDSGNSQCIGEEKLDLEVIDVSLPKQSLGYSAWFHCDCLADTYGTEIFSDRFFEIMESYVSLAAKHGMNMILLPGFTPPLDTPFGKERKTAQLVKVEIKNGEYAFDFSVMRRYIDICRRCGIKNFEHSHLFTQWGAKYAPKIMARAEGENKRIFGWETDSKSKEYGNFLACYLRALKVFLKEMDLEDRIVFHVSDEPPTESISTYENAVGIVRRELEGYIFCDALSDYAFYKKGYIQRPIVSVASADMGDFMENCEDLWVYYTGGELKDNSPNRNIPVPSSRNRVLGLQMYVGGAKGFLHWGYNYYYGALSRGIFNPIADPCGYKQLAGVSYIVYPDIRGNALPSIRLKVFYEAINDYGALQTLEDLTDRGFVMEFIRKNVGSVNYKYSPSNSELFDFRVKLNEEIAKNL